MKMRKWKSLYRVHKGHKVFEEVGTGRLAIADDSGDLPELTEDGLLWIDLSRKIWLETASCARLPLIDDKGRESHTPTSMGLARWLAEKTGKGIFHEHRNQISVLWPLS